LYNFYYSKDNGIKGIQDGKFLCISERKKNMQQVKLKEAQAHLLDLIDAVLKGETVVILKDDQEAVQLVPAGHLARRQFGSAKGLFSMADDFDAPLSDFSEYMA
jgi:antitoxin (DNA-binding transcriptional repressor) of toxin-antitoxin stability system